MWQLCFRIIAQPSIATVESCIISFGRHNMFHTLNAMTAFTCNPVDECFADTAWLISQLEPIVRLLNEGLGDGRVIVKRHGRPDQYLNSLGS